MLHFSWWIILHENLSINNKLNLCDGINFETNFIEFNFKNTLRKTYLFLSLKLLIPKLYNFYVSNITLSIKLFQSLWVHIARFISAVNILILKVVGWLIIGDIFQIPLNISICNKYFLRILADRSRKFWFWNQA